MTRPHIPLALTAIALATLASTTHAEVPEGLFGPSQAHKAPSGAGANGKGTPSMEELQNALREDGVATEGMASKMLEDYEIADMEPMPTPRFVAVEDARTGKMGFMSANGRYYIEGTLVDLWDSKHLKTVQDVRNSRQVIDADNLDFPNKATFQFGEGEQDVVIFTDPNCEICQGVMGQAKDIAEANDQYKFSVVQLPALGESSMPDVQRMWCGDAPESELLVSSITGEVSNIDRSPSCDTGRMAQAFVGADMIGIDVVPMIIAPDGHLARGLNTSFSTFLEEHSGEDQ
ncbi:thioredoxin fold domain-containing protein [Halomonas sp. I5-271120]|uniref:thioredoxin fold domain-containing protein n=1 Tax=Halomonas sp. I5-271120 TaxID=3061632 RepID=UPI002714F0CF|nr:thioredoxin fold domain-containing protein [Halomonas sp. I5-271120]